jgi:hypothetical protein
MIVFELQHSGVAPKLSSQNFLHSLSHKLLGMAILTDISVKGGLASSQVLNPSVFDTDEEERRRKLDRVTSRTHAYTDN